MKHTKITMSDKCDILLQLLIQEVGSDRALNIYNNALNNYVKLEKAIKPYRNVEYR